MRKVKPEYSLKSPIILRQLFSIILVTHPIGGISSLSNSSEHLDPADVKLVEGASSWFPQTGPLEGYEILDRRYNFTVDVTVFVSEHMPDNVVQGYNGSKDESPELIILSGQTGTLKVPYKNVTTYLVLRKLSPKSSKYTSHLAYVRKFSGGTTVEWDIYSFHFHNPNGSFVSAFFPVRGGPEVVSQGLGSILSRSRRMEMVGSKRRKKSPGFSDFPQPQPTARPIALKLQWSWKSTQPTIVRSINIERTGSNYLDEGDSETTDFPMYGDSGQPDALDQYGFTTHPPWSEFRRFEETTEMADPFSGGTDARPKKMCFGLKMNCQDKPVQKQVLRKACALGYRCKQKSIADRYAVATRSTSTTPSTVVASKKIEKSDNKEPAKAVTVTEATSTTEAEPAPDNSQWTMPEKPNKTDLESANSFANSLNSSGTKDGNDVPWDESPHKMRKKEVLLGLETSNELVELDITPSRPKKENSSSDDLQKLEVPYIGIGECRSAQLKPTSPVSTQDQVVGFYLEVLRVQCLPHFKTQTLRLFSSKLVSRGESLKISLNRNNSLFQKKTVGEFEWLDLSSAIFLSTFSNVYARQEEKFLKKVPDNNSPDGKHISGTVKTFTLLTLEVLGLMRSTEKPHAIKLGNGLIVALQAQRNELVSANDDLERCFKCEKEKEYNLNNQVQLYSLMRFIVDKLGEIVSSSKESVEEMFNKFHKQNLNLVVKYVKNKTPFVF